MAINAEAAEGTLVEATLGACRAVQLLRGHLDPFRPRESAKNGDTRQLPATAIFNGAIVIDELAGD